MAEEKFPFYVTTLEGAKVQGFKALEMAEAAAAEKNRQAEQLGIQSRYQAIEA
jgi:hypothetical protein